MAAVAALFLVVDSSNSTRRQSSFALLELLQATAFAFFAITETAYGDASLSSSCLSALRTSELSFVSPTTTRRTAVVAAALASLLTKAFASFTAASAASNSPLLCAKVDIASLFNISTFSYASFITIKLASVACF